MDRTSRASILLLASLTALVAACGSSGDSGNTTGATTAGTGGVGASAPGTGGTTTPGTGGSSSNGGGGANSGGGGGTPLPKSDYHLIGRIDMSDPTKPAFGWPGTAIVTRFSGTELHVSLQDTGDNWFAVVVDNGTPTVFTTSGGDPKDYVVAMGLAAGEHDVWIERRTESFDGKTTFLGFDPKAGHLVPTPEPFTRKIEFVGDSITCGYGNLGMGPGCHFSSDTEDEYLAWGAVAARALKAEHHGISYSGIGVYRNSGGSTDPTQTMPTKYERIFADDPNSHYDFAWQPDVVAVNLGTNDYSGGDPGQNYLDDFTAFAKQIRGHYPKALILLAVGSMLGQQQHDQVIGYFKTIIANRKTDGDTNLDWVDLGIQDGTNDGYGCDYHPTTATDQKMADKFVAKLHDKMGW